MIYLAMSYSGNNGFDLIATASCEDGAVDALIEWCQKRVEGFPQTPLTFSTLDGIRDWLSGNDAAERVTVEALPDAMFKPEAAYVTVDAGVCGVTLWDTTAEAEDRMADEKADPETGKRCQHFIVPLSGGHAGQSED